MKHPEPMALRLARDMEQIGKYEGALEQLKLQSRVDRLLAKHLSDLEFDSGDVYNVDDMIRAALKRPTHFRPQMQCPRCGQHAVLYHTGSGNWGCTKCSALGEANTYWPALQAREGK